MERNTRPQRAWLIAANLLASGCAFSIDASVIKETRDADVGDADQDASDPPGGGDAAREDGGGEADAGEIDASTYDAASQGDACAAPECPIACSEDTDCLEDEYCSRLAGECAPRCDDARGCAGPAMASIASLLDDGDLVYLTTQSGTDRFGNTLFDGAIWSWNLRDAPTKIMEGVSSPILLFVAEGYLHFIDWPGGLRRVSLVAGSSTEAIDEDAVRAWKTERAVYWSAQKTSSVELLRRNFGPTAAAERLQVATHDGWAWGNDELVFHSEVRRTENDAGHYLVSDQLSDLTMHQDLLGPEGGPPSLAQRTLFVRGSIIWMHGRGFQWVERIDLTDPERRAALSPFGSTTVPFLLRDGWVYWLATFDDERRELGRTHADLRAPQETLITWPAPALRASYDHNTAFAIVGQTVVYWAGSEGHLFTLTLPPMPCSSEAPCPDGQSCSAAMRCE